MPTTVPLGGAGLYSQQISITSMKKKNEIKEIADQHIRITKTAKRYIIEDMIGRETQSDVIIRWRKFYMGDKE